MQTEKEQSAGGLSHKKELQQMLQRLEARWNSGNIGDAHEIVKLDKQIKELKKKIQALGQIK